MSNSREGVNGTSVAQCIAKLWDLKENIIKLLFLLMAGKFLTKSGVENKRYATRGNSVDNKLFSKKCVRFAPCTSTNYGK